MAPTLHPIRLHDPTALDRAAIAHAVGQGRSVIAQFSRPGYTPALLAELNGLCAEFGEQVEARFFGHRPGDFDAVVLMHLPEVRVLQLDALTDIRNPHRIAELAHLVRLRFAVYRFDEPRFLERLDLTRLTGLTLGENKKRNLDLAPLATARRLTDLFIQGHTKHIEVIADLPDVADLGLSGIAGRQDLAFVSRMAGLRRLLLILGSRPDLAELAHPALEELRIIRVRGLAQIGPLARFPSLQVFDLEDQLQVAGLDLAGAPLVRVAIDNCKGLSQIAGWETLNGLVSLRISRTPSLDLDALVARAWPSSMKVLAFYSGSRRWNAEARAELDRRGYREHT